MRSSPVDFYILDESNAQKSLFFACQLIEKLHQEKQQIYVHMNSFEEASRFDMLLWTYRDDSFLPHQVYHPEEKFPPAIQIGYGENPKQHQDILMNFHRNVPSFYQHYARVIEIVFSEPLVQQLARERYRFYRDQGCEMNTIKNS